MILASSHTGFFLLEHVIQGVYLLTSKGLKRLRTTQGIQVKLLETSPQDPASLPP